MTSSTVKINNVEVYRINPTPPPTQPVSPDPQTATTMHELDLVARAREQVLRATNSPRQQIVNDYLTTFRSRPDLVDSVYVDAHGTIQCREVNHAGFEEIYLNDNQANMVTDVQRLLDEYRFWKGILERGCMIVIYDDESPLLVAEGNIEATWQELQRAYDNGPNSEDWEFITPAEAKAVANYPRLPDLED
ncbi:hypothetical protein KJ782_01485 [Patescibacteria group bacterium]|nr:hypothetical protein [Patescibacteria group bacterium]